MTAVLTAADATVIVAIVGFVGLWWQSRHNVKQLKPIAKELQPNAGSSLRDAIDRIEHVVSDQIVPRLDGFATVQADHSNRLAANEAAVVVSNIAVASLTKEDQQ